MCLCSGTPAAPIITFKFSTVPNTDPVQAVVKINGAVQFNQLISGLTPVVFPYQPTSGQPQAVELTWSETSTFTLVLSGGSWGLQSGSLQCPTLCNCDTNPGPGLLFAVCCNTTFNTVAFAELTDVNIIQCSTLNFQQCPIT